MWEVQPTIFETLLPPCQNANIHAPIIAKISQTFKSEVSEAEVFTASEANWKGGEERT